MTEDDKTICPYLESSHSMEVFYYICGACAKEESSIKPETVGKRRCFTLRYKNCRYYTNAEKSLKKPARRKMCRDR